MAASVLVIYDPVTLVQSMVVLNAANPADPAWNPPGLKQASIPRDLYDAKNHTEISKLIPPEVAHQCLATKSAMELGLVQGNIDPPKPLPPDEQKRVDDIATAMSELQTAAEQTALHVKLLGGEDIQIAKAEVIAARKP